MNFNNENIQVNIIINTKVQCKKCNKKFTTKTLKKHNGMCGRCFKSSGIIISTKIKQVNKHKLECKKCHKNFTSKTLKKYDGICKKCFNSSIGITNSNIPKKIKDEVWRFYVGDKFETQCYVCENTITATNFQAGHIESRRSGGKVTIDNLRPVCKKCNSQVGVFNMKEFKDVLTPNSTSKEKVKDEKPLAKVTRENTSTLTQTSANIWSNVRYLRRGDFKRNRLNYGITSFNSPYNKETKLENYIRNWDHSLTNEQHSDRLRFMGLLDLFNKKYPNSRFGN